LHEIETLRRLTRSIISLWVEAMRSRFLASLVALAFVAGLPATTFAGSFCGTEVVILKGQVENPPRDASVRVQLLYAKKQQKQLGKQEEQPGESGEVTVENGRFTIQIPFLNQYREPVIFAGLRDKCDRKPKTVVVTLLEGDQDEERDRVSLDLTKDFTKADATAYTPRSDIVLRGSR
jgi:hypothetical protein